MKKVNFILISLINELKNFPLQDEQENKLWTDEKFLLIAAKVYEKIEDMNPDSIIKILHALSIKKSRNQMYFDIYKKIINLV